MKLIIYTDGASRGNPGLASYGYIITDERGKLVHEDGKYIGTQTNNVAEYSGVLAALSWVKENIKDTVGINLFADSKLVAEQLSGKWKLKNKGLMPLFDQIKIIEMELGSVAYKYIPREKNTRADYLANRALDNKVSSSFLSK